MKQLSTTMCAEDEACLIVTKHTKYKIEVEITRNGNVEAVSFSLSEFKQFINLVANMLEVRVEEAIVNND